MCYEDLKQLYAATAKERDELKKELAYTKQLYEMAKVERDAVVKNVEASTLPDRRRVVSGRRENGVFYSDMTSEDIANILNAYASGMLAPVVHGRWEIAIDYDEFWGDLEYFKCSRCGNRELRNDQTPYCPNCGARMDGE